MITFAVGVILIGVAITLSYGIARERFSVATSTIAVAAVAAGTPIAWALRSGGDGNRALLICVGAALAYGWGRIGRGQTPIRQSIGAVVLGLIGVAPFLHTPVRWAAPDIIDVLWSSAGGVLTTSPVLCVALVGLFALFTIDRARAGAGLLLFALFAWLAGASTPWTAAADPSPPIFCALLPYFVCGVAALIDRCSSVVARHPGVAATAGLSSLVIWNITLVNVAHNGGLRLGEPTSFADVGAAQARALHAWMGHPASYPANLGYALMNHVAPARFDLLRPNRLLANGATTGRLDIGGDDAWFLGDGWHDQERDGDRTFRWATSVADLALPLDHADDVTIAIDVRPIDLSAGQIQRLILRVNGIAQPDVPLTSGWQTIRMQVPRRAWRAGVNHITLVFSGQSRPSDTAGTDTRWLAASVDAFNVSTNSRF